MSRKSDAVAFASRDSLQSAVKELQVNGINNLANSTLLHMLSAHGLFM